MSQSEPLLSSLEELGGHAPHEMGGSRARQLTIWFGRRAVKYLVNGNVLLVFVPLGLVAGNLQWDAVVVLVLNFLAIVPLSAFVSSASDTLAARWGSLLGGLFNATSGNAVEIIVGILAINRDQIPLAQSMMLGSILSDILLVLGVCLITAARGRGFIRFKMAVVDALSSLMLIATMALILPTALYSTFPKSVGVDIGEKIISFSRATASVLLLIYLIYLYFQLKTHKSLFLDEKEDFQVTSDWQGEAVEERGREGAEVDDGLAVQEDDELPSERQVYTAVAILILSAAAIMNCTQYLIDSVDDTARVGHISKTFIGMIVLPIASNAPELFAVMGASRKGRINYAIGVIVGSILQVALFVLPALVILGWLMGQGMSLYFKTSQTCMLFLAVLMVNQVLQGGWYTYLHGVILLSLYIIVVLAAIAEPYQ